LIERSLQSSEAHIEAGQSLGFSSSKVWCTFLYTQDPPIQNLRGHDPQSPVLTPMVMIQGVRDVWCILGNSEMFEKVW